MPTSAKSFLRIVWNGRRDERKGKGARVAGMLKKEDQLLSLSLSLHPTHPHSPLPWLPPTIPSMPPLPFPSQF